MKFDRQMQKHQINETKLTVYNAFKDNINKLADLKQQQIHRFVRFVMYK